MNTITPETLPQIVWQNQKVITTELLPPSLRSIAEYCGDEVAWLVWKHYGGGHVCVPDKLTAEHTLAVTIGLEAASLLSQHFGKEILVIPKLQKIRDAIRNKSICQLRQEGWDLFKLARKFDLTERQISTICQSRVVVDVGQLDLFV